MIDCYKWISVDDRLPEVMDIYLTAFSNGGVWNMMFDPKDGKWTGDDCNELTVTDWTSMPRHPRATK